MEGAPDHGVFALNQRRPSDPRPHRQCHLSALAAGRVARRGARSAPPKHRCGDTGRQRSHRLVRLPQPKGAGGQPATVEGCESRNKGVTSASTCCARRVFPKLPWRKTCGIRGWERQRELHDPLLGSQRGSRVAARCRKRRDGGSPRRNTPNQEAPTGALRRASGTDRKSVV